MHINQFGFKKEIFIKKWLLSIVIAAGFTIFYFYYLTNHPTPLIVDARWFHDVGLNLVSGNGFFKGNPNILPIEVIPGYPIFIAGIYKCFGVNPKAVIYSQTILFILSGFLLLSIVRRFGCKSPYDIVGLICFYGYLPFLQYCNFLLSEILFISITIFMVWFQMRWNPFCRTMPAFLVGVIMGIIMLVRAASQFYPLFYITVFGIVNSKSRFCSWRGFGFTAAVMLAGIACVVLPWTYRNYLVSNKFVAVAAYGGRVIWAGNNPQSGGKLTKELRTQYLEKRDSLAMLGLSTSENDSYFIKAALYNMLRNPSATAYGFVVKIQRFWFGWDISEGLPDKRRMVIIFVNLLLLVLCVGGSINLYRSCSFEVYHVWIFIAYIFLVHVFTYAMLRYSLPAMPCVMALSCVMIQAITNRIIQRRSSAEKVALK